MIFSLPGTRGLGDFRLCRYPRLTPWHLSKFKLRLTHGQARGTLPFGLLEKKFPFPIRAIQIDGGSEFKKDFEEAVRKRGILLFVIPPHSPKLKSYVGRANRTHREEFYEVETIGHTMEEHNQQLEIWEYTCNYIRPHQALDYLTPAEYYQTWIESQGPKCH